MDCGPTSIQIIAKFYGKTLNIEKIRNYCEIGKNGVNLIGIANGAENIGFKTRSVKLTYNQLCNEVQLPCIVHFNQNHFVVVTPQINNKIITISDPSVGVIKYTKQEFINSWLSTNTEEGEEAGIALLLSPTKKLNLIENEIEDKIGSSSIFEYLLIHKKYFLQIFLSLIIGSCLQLLFPFLTQSIIDTGINTHNINYIYIVLIAQLTLYFSKTIIEFIRSRLMLFISTRINISILSDFWIKLMKLPLSYFDTKHVGDILQRIQDQKRIEQFLTYSSISTLFSIISIFIFSLVLFNYSFNVFSIYAVASILYFLWIRIFLKFRKSLEFQRFSISAKENTATMQLVYGMQEIKINNSEYIKRWKWEDLQSKSFKLNFKTLSISQYQQVGAVFINEGKNIIITFLVAKSVINGQLTLGAMLAIQYIVGQLNSPIEQLIQFVQQAQDAKLSFERLNEIHNLDDEDKNLHSFSIFDFKETNINISNLSFAYPGAGNNPVLKNINLNILKNKTTAIVGTSGSGKTTILKLLQQFYNNYTGEIRVDNILLNKILPSQWRSLYGCVMQDGYIFSDTISNNIAVGDEVPDQEKLIYSCSIANILEFINGLPLGFNTIIGAEGNGLSQGQKQRLLIARAVYKNPQFVFFDEATNALDAHNERVILENLQTFFKGRTVVIVAHRLSTVKNADNILVLEMGEIIEEGSHIELCRKKGYYYNLIKNQLELGE
jgi:ATP-binding cassette subfamily B protein